MKNIKYFIFTFFALFLFISPTYALKINTDKSSIPYTEEEIKTYIEAIKSSTEFTTEMQTYNTYMIAFQSSGSTNIFNSAETTNVLTFCFRNDTFQFSDPTSALLCESNRYIYFPLNNGIVIRPQKSFNVNYLKYLLESNMNITYFEDVTDVDGNVLYATGENIFNTSSDNVDDTIVYEYSETFNIFGVPILMSYDYYLENVINVYFVDLTLSDDIKFLTYIVINFFLLAFWYVIIKFLYTFIIYIKNGLF